MGGGGLGKGGGSGGGSLAITGGGGITAGGVGDDEKNHNPAPAMAVMMRTALMLRSAAHAAPAVTPPAATKQRWEVPKIDPRFACTLEAPPLIRLGDPLPVTFRLRNVSTKDTLRILSYILGDQRGNHYTVDCNGQPMKYLTTMIAENADPPPESAYVTMKPNDEASSTYPISAMYELRPGRCIVGLPHNGGLSDIIEDLRIKARPQSQWHHHDREKLWRSAYLDCKPVTVQVLPGQ